MRWYRLMGHDMDKSAVRYKPTGSMQVDCQDLFIYEIVQVVSTICSKFANIKLHNFHRVDALNKKIRFNAT